MVLVNAMRNKPKLRLLNLDGNCFGEEGAEQIVSEMNQLPTASALQPFEENISEEEESGEEEEEADYDEDEDEDYDEHEHANDTTEEADEDDEEYNTQAEETAYVTTNAYTTKVS